MLASKTMMRMIRVLLTSEVKMSLRSLVKKADVVLSRGAIEINRLEEVGYISKGRVIRVERREDLLMAFSYMWSIRAIPFRAFEALERPEYIMDIIKDISEDKEFEYGLTMLSAAELISPSVIPSSVHLYIDKAELDGWIEALKDKGIFQTPSRTHGKVNLLFGDGSIMHGGAEIGGYRCVSRTQIFADLHGMGGIFRSAAYDLAERNGWRVR